MNPSPRFPMIILVSSRHSQVGAIMLLLFAKLLANSVIQKIVHQLSLYISLKSCLFCFKQPALESTEVGNSRSVRNLSINRKSKNPIFVAVAVKYIPIHTEDSIRDHEMIHFSSSDSVQ